MTIYQHDDDENVKTLLAFHYQEICDQHGPKKRDKGTEVKSILIYTFPAAPSPLAWKFQA